MRSLFLPPIDLFQPFLWINELPRGRRILNEILFNPQSRVYGKLEVLPFPQNLSLLEQRGAFFMTDGEVGQIFVDCRSPLGLVIPFLFHELVHSLDDSIWRAARHPLPWSEKKEILFNAECRAHSAQFEFLQELVQKHSELQDFYKSQYPNYSFLHRMLTPSEINDLYTNAYEAFR